MKVQSVSHGVLGTLQEVCFIYTRLLRGGRAIDEFHDNSSPSDENYQA